MLLNNQELLEELDQGALKVAPYRREMLRGASIVLTLGSRFRRWRRNSEPIKLWSPEAAKVALEPAFDSNDITLVPGEFVLGSTSELLCFPRTLAGEFFGLSHVARFGLSVCSGAHAVGPGFGAERPTPLVLELYNQNPSSLILTAGMPIGHLRVTRLSQAIEPSTPASTYEGADPVTDPKLYEEWTKRLAR